MRAQFDKQLEQLYLELIEMGALCEDAIAAVIHKLLHDDEISVDGVAAIEKEINQKERDIESLCMKIILRQQPVAGDLRMISSALKMIIDMERIGDQAADIAEIAKFVVGSTIDKVHIKDMAGAAIKMVTESVDSFVKSDMNLARDVIEQDDIVDVLFDTVKKELISIIRDDADNGEQAIDLLMIAKYLERIGDHAVNISEEVIYSITGKQKENL